MADLSKFEQALAERRAKKAESNAFQAAKAGAAAVADLVPERQHSDSPEEQELDRIIGNIGIVEAYGRWCGKMIPIKRQGQTEGVMVSCPVPGHVDKNPSAWMNTTKNTWYCGACDTGGDVYDLAAYRFGATDYKSGSAFHDLRRQIAGDLGYAVQRSHVPGVPDNIYRVDEPGVRTAEPAESSDDAGSREPDPSPVRSTVPDSNPGVAKPRNTGSDLWDDASTPDAQPVSAQQVRDAFAALGKRTRSSDAAGPRDTPDARGDGSRAGEATGGSPVDLPGIGPAGGHQVHAGATQEVAPDGTASEPEADNVVRVSFGGGSDGRGESDVEDLAALFTGSIDWRDIVPEGTFLWEYLKAATVDSTPEEYHFWNGLIAISLAAGRRITLWDEDLVYGNLMICLLGHTGMRKSRSIRVMTRLTNKAAPYMESDGSGILDIQGAASGEVLISMFDHKSAPVGAAKVGMSTGNPIVGYVNFSEMSALTSRAARQGSVIKDVLMQLADGDDKISTSSLTRGKIEAKLPYGCVQTTTQPESLKTLLDSETDVNSGFLNRWIFAPGTEKYQPSVGGTVVDVEGCVWPYQQIIRQDDRVIDWTDGAKEKWEEFFQTVVKPTKRGQHLLGRLDLTIKKLFLLFAVNENLDAVTEDLVERVFKIYPYLIKAYNATSENLVSQTASGEMYEDIMAQIRRLSGTPGYEYGPTKSQVIDRIKKKKNFDPMVAGRIFDMFNDNRHDDIEVNQGKPGPGRKSEHYKWIGTKSS